MRPAEVVIGNEYGVRLGRQHVLIGDTDVTYKERLDFFRSLDYNELPRAAHDEYGRVRTEWTDNIEQRIAATRRAPSYEEWRDGEWERRFGPRWIKEHKTVVVFATVVERQGSYFIIESEYSGARILIRESIEDGVLRARVRGILGSPESVLAATEREYEETKRQVDAISAKWARRRMEQFDPAAEAEQILHDAGRDDQPWEPLA